MDSELVAKARAGEPEAIESLVRENQAVVYRVCLSILHNPEDAEDCTQETFIAALKALDRFRGDSQLSTWLYAIAVNTCRGYLRKSGRQGRVEDAVASEAAVADGQAPGPERNYQQTEKSEELWQAINQLSEKLRLPIILRYYHDLSTDEIAQVLDVKVGTIHSRLSNARNELSGHLQRLESGMGGEE